MNFLQSKLIVLFFWVFIPITVVAQTRCPVGVQAGNVQCLPDEEESPPPRPTGEWIKTWGGIATSPSGNGGVSSFQLTKEDAEEVALQNCKNTGAETCRVSFVYQNQCVALVYPVGGQGSFIVSAGSIKKAVKAATSNCEAAAKGHECKLKFSECSDPIFKKY